MHCSADKEGRPDPLVAPEGSLVDLVEAVRALPYDRPTDRSIEGLLRERRGTCSTKHLFLARALEERFPETKPEIVHRVYRAERERIRALYGDRIAAVVPEEGLVDVHRYLRIRLAGRQITLDVTFPHGEPWDGRASLPLACGPGDDIAAGAEPEADKRMLENRYCDSAVREPFIAALSAVWRTRLATSHAEGAPRTAALEHEMTSERELRDAQPANRDAIAPTRSRAVVFDLWDTLVDFPWELAEAHFSEMAQQLRVDTERLRSTWRKLEPQWETMPLMPALQLLCRELDAREADTFELRTLRLDYMRQALKPRTEVTKTLRELRRRGVRLGLITACSGDVPLVWAETPLAGLFDATVFSSAVGFCKPDPRIYKRALEDLRVSARTCLYVGDGGHDELAGATRAGMTAALLQRRNKPPRPQVRAWEPRITTIADVLNLV